jgi:hypothetical protein
MQYSLEMFGHLIADKASICLVDDPQNLPALFEKFRADFADDPERLAVIADVEAMAASFAGREIAEQMGYRVKAKRARRHRKPKFDALIEQAKKAGRNVTSVVVGGVELRFGEQKAGNGAAIDVDRELAEFEARHET